MNPQDDVTFVIVSFKMEHLVAKCLESIATHYNRVAVILVDNGSCNEAEKFAVLAAEEHDSVLSIILSQNIGHGNGMHIGISIATTPYVFTLDTDATIIDGGFLEMMLEEFECDPDLFAVGWSRFTNAQGVAYRDQTVERGYENIHPYAMMIDRKKYFTLVPFRHAGAPATKTMISAVESGYSLLDFPIGEYVNHSECGTRGWFLGRWNIGSSAISKEWHHYRV